MFRAMAARIEAERTMSLRTKKLVGTVLLIAFVALYALAAMAIGAMRLPGASHFAEWAYYVVAGLAWVIPAGAIIAWMQRP